jgi:tetratricopeptide (TPR) repeat protein
MLAAFTKVKGSPLARRPLPHYAIVYFRYLAHLDASVEQARWAAVQPADTVHVFPSLPAMDPVLRYAVQADPADAAARLYLGNLYAHLGRLEEAAVLWQEALDADARLHVAARNLAVYLWRARGEPARAVEYFRTAVAAAPEDQTLYRDLAKVLVSLEQPAEAVDLLESMPELPVVRGDVTMLLAETLVTLGEHARAADVLAHSEISTWEAQTRPHEIWAEAHMAIGVAQFESGNHEQALVRFEAALDYPPNLGMGRPSAPPEAKERYWQGRALEALGRVDEARAAWEAGAAGPDGSADQNEHKEKCREALAGAREPAAGAA